MKPVKILLMLPVYLIGLLILIILFTLLNKAYWDARVRYLCLNEGGVTIFKTVNLSAPEYVNIPRDVNGTPLIRSERAKGTDDLFYVVTSTNLQVESGGVEILEDVFEIMSSAGGESLGRAVTYIRSGGDFVTFGSPGSSYTCNNIEGFDLDLHGKVFK